MTNVQVWLDDDNPEEARLLRIRERAKREYGTYKAAYAAMLEMWEGRQISKDNRFERIEDKLKDIYTILSDTLDIDSQMGNNLRLEACSGEATEDFSEWGI